MTATGRGGALSVPAMKLLLQVRVREDSRLGAGPQWGEPAPTRTASGPQARSAQGGGCGGGG